MAISKVTTSNTNTINKVTVTDGDAVSIITVGTQGLAGPATILGRTIAGSTVSTDDIGATLIYDHANTRWLATTDSNAASLNLKIANLNFTAGGATATGILDEDNLGTNSNTKLATQQSIKAYVDAQLTAQDLDFQGDSGGALSIDLDSETLSILGGTGLATVGSGNGVTVNIDSTVTTLTGSQTLTNKTLTAPVLNTVDINGGDISSGTTINKSPQITLAGDLSGSVTLSNLANGTLTATIVANSVALGTDTTGNYLATLVASNAGIDLANSGSESAAVTAGLNTEYVQDLVGAMFSSNTETGISVTYQDGDGTIDLVIGAGVITSAMLAGSVANAKLANSTITVSDGSNTTAIALGSTITYAAGEGLDVAESSGTVTFSAEDATASNKGVASFDSTDFAVSSGAVTLVVERISDIVGSMVTSNTESGIAVTYQDSDNTIDFDVGDFDIALTGDVTGSGTVTNLGNVSFAATIQANSVALGTDTTGNYVGTITGGTGIDSTAATSGEGTTHTLSLNLNELTTETTIADADFIAMVDATDDGSGKITFENLEDAIFSSISGDVTIAEDGVATIQANSVALGTDTTGSYLLEIAVGEGLDVSHTQGEGSTATLSAELATETNAGVATFDGTDFTVSSGDVTVNVERVQDIVGAMVGSNTESGIAVTYEDGDGTLDFNVNDPTITISGDIDGSATMTNLGNTTISTTLDTVNSNVGSFGSATAIPALTVNAKGLITAISTNSLTTNFTLSADSGTNDTFATGETLTFSGTTNEVTTAVSNNAITIGLPDNVTIGGNLIVTGDYTVNGTTTTVSTATLAVEDPLIKLAKGNAAADSVDIGIYGLYDTSGSQDLYAGLFRDANDSGKWKLFKDLQPEPTTTVNVSGTGYAVATLVANLEGAVTGNADTATALATARTIHGVSFDGTANIDLSEVVSDTVGAMFSSNTETGITATYQDGDNTIDLVVGTLNQDTTGLAATATALATARTIHGVSFDGTGNIDLSEVISDTVGAMFSSNTETNITVTYQDADNTIDLVIGTLNQDTTGLAGTATALATARTIGGTSFDGTANIAVALSATATALANARTIHGVSFDGTANISLTEEIQDTVGAMFTSNTESGITVAYDDIDGTVDFTVGTLNQNTTGLAATATALATARTIHGVSFDGTGNIDLSEEISDTVGAMFSGNTETNITVTYQDADNTIDLVIGTLNQDTTGLAATATLAASATALATARTIHGVSFDGTGNIDLSEVIADTVGAMFSSNTETGVTVTYQDVDNTVDVVVDTSALTETLTNKTLTSPVFNTGVSGTAIKDEDNLASDSATHLATQQSIKAYVDSAVSTTEGIQDIVGAMFSSNTETGITVTYQDVDGTVDLVIGTLNQDTTGTAALATSLTISANNSANETVYPVFVDGATGTQGAETDTGLTYNPSTGLLTATGFSGNLTGTLQTAAQANVTSVGTLTSLSVTGDLAIDTNVLKVDTTNNRVGIKQATPTVGLDLGSVTDAILVAKGTTAQRPTGAAGHFRYNTTLGKFEGYTDAWGEIGGGGTSTFAVNNYTTANSSTTAFTLSSAPDSEDNILVFVEGVFMNAADYTLNGTTLTLDAAPPSGRKVTVYHVTAAVAGTGVHQNSFTGNGSATAYTLGVTADSENNTQVYIDGVYQNKATYAISGTTLTFDTAPASSAAIEVMTFTQTNINTFPASGISGLTQVTAAGADHFMIFDATDNALKKSLVSDVLDNVVLTSEQVQDVVGGMVSSNTETGVAVTYEDGDGTLDFVLATAQPTVTSLGTLTTLTVDNVIINGSTIGHTGDTDLITVASGIATVAGEVSMTTLDIGGTNVTATATELNYVDGVTSAIQTQMDTKASTGKAIAMAMIFG